ncbi:MAG: hypothetical protein NC433_05590 [Clostridiales bacterium]|nr:hypothetical protein [Clostridiales bacterium]
MTKNNKQTNHKQKGDDGMQAVLKNDNIAAKIQLLKAKADKVLKDDTLRHVPNEHDIKKCSDNTKLLHTYQEKTIGKED